MKPQALVVDRWVFGSLTYEISFALFRPRQLGEYRWYLLFISSNFRWIENNAEERVSYGLTNADKRAVK